MIRNFRESSSKRKRGGEDLADEAKLPEGRPSREQMRAIVDRYYDAKEELEHVQEEFKKIQELYRKAVERSME